jgi:hypothetical protein
MGRPDQAPPPEELVARSVKQDPVISDRRVALLLVSNLTTFITGTVDWFPRDCRGTIEGHAEQRMGLILMDK